MSTIEVSNILTNLDFVEDACVYGVTVPGSDGRIGMAAVTLSDGSKFMEQAQLKALYMHCTKHLPNYAQPYFIRVKRSLEMTYTFKQMKTALAEQGFDPQQMNGDCLFCMDKLQQSYIPMTQSIFDHVSSGQARL